MLGHGKLCAVHWRIVFRYGATADDFTEYHDRRPIFINDQCVPAICADRGAS